MVSLRQKDKECRLLLSLVLYRRLQFRNRTRQLSWLSRLVDRYLHDGYTWWCRRLWSSCVWRCSWCAQSVWGPRRTSCCWSFWTARPSGCRIWRSGRLRCTIWCNRRRARSQSYWSCRCSRGTLWPPWSCARRCPPTSSRRPCTYITRARVVRPKVLTNDRPAGNGETSVYGTTVGGPGPLLITRIRRRRDRKTRARERRNCKRGHRLKSNTMDNRRTRRAMRCKLRSRLLREPESNASFRCARQVWPTVARSHTTFRPTLRSRSARSSVTRRKHLSPCTAAAWFFPRKFRDGHSSRRYPQTHGPRLPALRATTE